MEVRRRVLRLGLSKVSSLASDASVRMQDFCGSFDSLLLMTLDLFPILVELEEPVLSLASSV